MPRDISEVTQTDRSLVTHDQITEVTNVDTEYEQEIELPSESQFYAPAYPLNVECFSAELSCHALPTCSTSSETLKQDRVDDEVCPSTNCADNGSDKFTPRRLEPIKRTREEGIFPLDDAMDEVGNACNTSFYHHIPLPGIRSVITDAEHADRTFSDSMTTHPKLSSQLSGRYTPLPAIVRSQVMDLTRVPASIEGPVSHKFSIDHYHWSQDYRHINNSASDETYAQVEDSNTANKKRSLSNKRQALVEQLSEVSMQLNEKTALVELNNTFIRLQDAELDGLMSQVYELHGELEPLVGEIIAAREGMGRQKEVYEQLRVECFTADISIGMLERELEEQMKETVNIRREIAELSRIQSLYSSGRLDKAVKDIEGMINGKRQMNKELEGDLNHYKERQEIQNVLPVRSKFLCGQQMLERGGGDPRVDNNPTTGRVKPRIYRRQMLHTVAYCSVDIMDRERRETNTPVKDREIDLNRNNEPTDLKTGDQVTDKYDDIADNVDRNIDACLTNIRTKLVAIKETIMDRVGKVKKTVART